MAHPTRCPCCASLCARAQAAIQPPTFVFFVNDSKMFTDDYRRYMERQLRDNIGEQRWPCIAVRGGARP